MRRSIWGVALALLLVGCGGGGDDGPTSVCGGPVESTPELCNFTVTPNPVPVGQPWTMSLSVSDLEGDIDQLCITGVNLDDSGNPVGDPVVDCVEAEPRGTLINETITVDGEPFTADETGRARFALVASDRAGHTSNTVTLDVTVE